MRISFFLIFLFVSILSFAQPSYVQYNRFLQRNVTSSGSVNYKAIKSNRKSFDSIVDNFSKANPSSSWTTQQQLAFWINAYNVFTIKLIVENYPLESITKLDGGKPWDVKRITIGGKKYSLNQIENEIIRPTFKNEKIHFAVNCAAKSCPPLHNRAFLPGTLSDQLDARSRAFVNSKSNVLAANEVKVSKIFDWYKEDFPNLINFLNSYSKVKINPGAKVSYMEYNWKLNE
jgi:hypothetical protein